MFLTEFFVAFFFSILTGIIFATKRYQGPWEEIWAYVVLIFLFTWGSETWMTPMGNLLAAFFYFAVIFSLIMVAISPRRRPFKWKTKLEKTNGDQEIKIAAALTLNIFFWLLIISFLVSL